MNQTESETELQKPEPMTLLEKRRQNASRAREAKLQKSQQRKSSMTYEQELKQIKEREENELLLIRKKKLESDIRKILKKKKELISKIYCET